MEFRGLLLISFEIPRPIKKLYELSTGLFLHIFDGLVSTRLAFVIFKIIKTK